MIQKIKDNIVYWGSLGTIIIIIFFTLLNIDTFASASQNALDFLLANFSWIYAGVVLILIYFSIWLMLSKYGNIRLGKNDEKPKYSFLSWLSMLFSAGMGIGLIFWGVAEPLNHYLNPMNMEPMTSQAKSFALGKSFLHWGISAWSCYAVLALALAYFQFRKQKPALISSVLHPILGDRPIIKIIVDIFTIFATIAGVVTTLGLGTLQINAGLNYLFNVPENVFIQLIIIVMVTIAFLISAAQGLDNGIQKISNFNLTLAAILLGLAIIIGPTMKMAVNFMDGLVFYGKDLLTSNNNFLASGKWYESWTFFYWGWWIAWAPPVAVFIARISRGRTIRQFLVGVLLVPSFLCCVWFAVFGSFALDVDASTAQLAVQQTETALFVLMNNYQFGTIISILAILLLGTFFITSADSATFVLGMLSSNGNLNPKNSRKLVWGIIQGTLTIVLLMAGGLEMVQTISILAAFPFMFIILLSIVSLMKSLRKEHSLLEYQSKHKERWWVNS
ncbi:glycine betaine transporter [Desulfonispora thiosulfatigenes DSM 11270]|uniref:Glycine betaine transporter n=1 Tax=Desulfonispora thiosulfatigenes DSM 11270 TaxID=656914 RepID=A0A1W1V1Q2_DESTI|nr:BCCT family transporter [Desulfonispora thiosulfatigenes]SMB87252.1 glycine betaine transporter [Desulfonispora thiosulfatigenes DSM 11270]